MTDLQLPDINYAAIAPILILFGFACAGVLVEAFVPRAARYPVQMPLALLGLAAGLAAVVRHAGTADFAGTTAAGAVAVDGPALFLQGSIIVLGALALLLAGEQSVEPGGPFVAQAGVTADSEADRRQAEGVSGGTEVFPLALFALAGMLLFVAANDLLTLFIALEVFSLPLYLLCALARRRRLLSQEAALKYFLLGAYASAFFLFGVALIYGFVATAPAANPAAIQGPAAAGNVAAAAAEAGTSPVAFSVIHQAVRNTEGGSQLLLGGFALLAIGLLFKAAVAPFHVWTPDVYQGAPTPVTALMAACTKVAAFGALLRVLYVAFDGVSWDYRPILGGVAILTMLVGAILAVTQADIKRLLAYSSIANAGYLLVGALAVSRDGLSSTMFYLVAYGFSVVVAFGMVTLVRDAEGEATHLSRWAGLGRRAPWFAGVFTFVLLAFAGIPLTSGFISKFAVFGAAWDGNQRWLVIVGVVSSMIIAFPYLRVVVMMWLSEPGESTPVPALPGGWTSAALMIGVLATLVLGVLPAPLLELTDTAAEFFRAR